MEINVENIDKDDKKTQRKIYKAFDEPYFEEVKLFPKSLLNTI